ncbi:MAG TPA: winged helix-turn-helix domain-containing protein [Vicinamibacterales bacterium]|nr:winged helix-turn-helix domain-containing protein [Vicinamibacterales bacterium]
MIRFGSFQIDPRTWLLTKEQEPVDLSPRLVEILAFIVSRAGQIVTKEELLERFWPDVNVTENTLTRAIADIRKAIGDDASAPKYLATASRRGYQFVGESVASPATDPFQEWVKGRLALDTLDASKLDEAVNAFERTVSELPRYAPAHAGLANGYLLQYEKTRFGSAPDRTLLERAMQAAREATVLDPSLGEGWAVLGYLLSAGGKSEEGQAAARRATALEPNNWRHHYRLAYGSWGEERLRSVDRALALMPEFAPARMLACMVFVARGSNARAEQEAAIGAESQRRQHADHTPLRAVGHHWMFGLIKAAAGDHEAALASFDEEISAATSDHVYAREFALNAHVASGFVKLAKDDLQGASASFAQALAQDASHQKAQVGTYAIAMRSGNSDAIAASRTALEAAIVELTRRGRDAEAALVSAGALIVRGELDQAVAGLDRLLTTAPAGPAGWIIPIDPMLAAVRNHAGKQALFAKLAARAS